jgi:hypothetical protein
MVKLECIITSSMICELVNQGLSKQVQADSSDIHTRALFLRGDDHDEKNSPSKHPSLNYCYLISKLLILHFYEFSNMPIFGN